MGGIKLGYTPPLGLGDWYYILMESCKPQGAVSKFVESSLQLHCYISLCLRSV